MLEWYRRDASYLDIADDLERLLAELSGGAIGGVKRLKVREAYLKYAGWDPWENWDRDRFDFDMAVKIEPALKELGGGVFLTDYPREAASLAVTRGDHAERWEFYLDGVELANCFTELCDREEQKARFVRAKGLRKTLGESDYPIDFEFLDIVADMGSPAGVALGVDRLVMRLTGADSISAVRAPE
jgi:lysyl-tRNA synthetase class 2